MSRRLRITARQCHLGCHDEVGNRSAQLMFSWIRRRGQKRQGQGRLRLLHCRDGVHLQIARKARHHVTHYISHRHHPRQLLHPTCFPSSTVESSSCRTLIMATPQAHHLFHASIEDHSFSSDRQTLAVTRENNVELYQSSGNKFTLSDELKGHEKTVTSVDIAPDSGRIVTCSQGELD